MTAISRFTHNLTNTAISLEEKHLWRKTETENLTEIWNKVYEFSL